MKKLIFILLFFYPVFIFAQQQIVLKSGIQFEAYIRAVQGNDLFFYNEVKEIDSKKVDIMLIRSISGEFSELTKKKLAKKNQEIVFNSTYIPETKDNSYKEYDQVRQLTTGDLIKRSSVLRLSGFALTTATATVLWAGAFKDDPETQKTVAIAAGVVSLGLYIAGEITLFNAGKALNREAVTLSPASQGIGLAIKF